MPHKSVLLAVAMPLWLVAASNSQDTVEFMSGAKARGKVKEIRKEEKEFDFEAKISQRTISRTYDFKKVHAVTMNGKRFVVTPKTASGKTRGDGNVGKESSGKGSDSTEVTKRTKREVMRQINDIGKEPPSWFAATQLDYPDTLDLTWPLKPPTKKWESHKNMNQYIWSVINENPSHWRSGIKLVHHCVTLHKDEPILLKRDMKALGDMYFRLFQDYPRAAFWLQRGAGSQGRTDVSLAECYWRMGNKRMALDMLKSRSLPVQTIKLFGDMGETQRAVRLADVAATSRSRYQAFLLAGDALRQAGQYEKAINYYQRVIDGKGFRNKEYEDRAKLRARESVEAIKVFDRADVSQVAEGVYTDSSTGYAGAVNVEVKVTGGRIETVKITDHKEKQFYAALTDTPNQIIKKQSIKGIDATSRATITSQAIVNATAKALAKGAK